MPQHLSPKAVIKEKNTTISKIYQPSRMKNWKKITKM
jgi:hypothetical protein